MSLKITGQHSAVVEDPFRLLAQVSLQYSTLFRSVFVVAVFDSIPETNLTEAVEWNKVSFVEPLWKCPGTYTSSSFVTTAEEKV